MMRVSYFKPQAIAENEFMFMQNYQLYAQRYFVKNFDKLNWFFIDYKTGTGKTLTALYMVQAMKQPVIVCGNAISQIAFQNDINKINIDGSNFEYTSYQKLPGLSEDIFKGKILIVDEFQNLYSQEGLNSYGEYIQKIMNNKKLNVKCIALSGTPVNTIWQELNYIISIFDESWDIQNQDKNKIIQKCQDHFLSYHKIQNEDDYPTLLYNGEKKELHEFSSFPVIHCPYSSKEDTKESNEDENSIFKKQRLLPLYYYQSSTPIKNNQIIEDVDLNKAPVAKFIIENIKKTIRENKGEGGKTVIYSDMVDVDFGQKQYIQILIENGFIQYKDKPNADTICCICGEQYSKHSKKNHEYMAARFLVYSSDLDLTQRKELINDMFNTLQNKNGNLCYVIILSQIAETGLSLYGINDFYITDYIPGYSLYQQIIARAVRFKSHFQLADTWNYVNVYNPVAYNTYYKYSYTEELYNRMFKNGKEFLEVLDKIRSKKVDDKIFDAVQFVPDNIDIARQYLMKQPLTNSYGQNEFIKSYKSNYLPFKVIKNNVDMTKINPYFLSKYDIKLISDIELQKVVNQCYLLKTSNLNYLDIIINETSLQSQQIKFFIKEWQSHFINNMNKYIFKWNTIFSAYYIFEGYVYMKDDEEKFKENHKKLFEDIYKMQLADVYKDQKRLIRKHNIEGIYYKNDVYDKTGIIKHTKQKVILDKVCYYLTSNIPSLTYKNVDFYISQKQFIDQNNLYNQDQFQQMNLTQKIRYNLMYYYNQNIVDVIEFV